MNEYINYFKNLVNQQKNISNYDEIFLRERNCIDSYTGDAKNYNAHFEIIKRNYPYSFSDYLVPEPFAGDISNAKIFCVMLNPALKGNEFIEQQDISFKNMLLNNINQNYDSDYPFWPLNPRFSKSVLDCPGCIIFSLTNILAYASSSITFLPFSNLMSDCFTPTR